MNVIDALDQARAQVNVLEHPFYERWRAGELRAGELARYAGEYRHAVGALAHASELAAAKASREHRSGLAAHAAEEAAHVALWDAFARAAGARAPAAEQPASPQTQSCVRAWTAGEEVLEHLAVLYAIEAGQAEVARTKLEGLVEHYGYRAEGPACEYFQVHALRDSEHAREGRALITTLIGRAQDGGELGERMLVRARAALEGNWMLLDGVQAHAAEA